MSYHPGAWSTPLRRKADMPHVKPGARVLMANVLPDLDAAPGWITQDALDYAECPWRSYIHELLLETERLPVGERPAFREIYDRAKARYERDTQAGIERHPATRPWTGRDDRYHRDVVYYARMDRLVKIGTTARIRERMDTIMPQGVLAVEFGDRILEGQRHNQFVQLHSHGEWFWMDPALWAHIVEIRAAFECEVESTTEEWLSCQGVTLRPIGGPPLVDDGGSNT